MGKILEAAAGVALLGLVLILSFKKKIHLYFRYGNAEAEISAEG